MSPGSAFFLPGGDYIYTALENLMRRKLVKYDYVQVRTPQLFFKELWETSGHWAKYQQNMFVLESEKRVQSLKPMNCPGHCLIFRSRARSYRELPLRMAEFGCCHRNELSGTLHGLSRVRRFTQDDAHIFCAPDAIKEELMSCLNLMKEVYAIFGLDHSLMLSTRPKLYIGELDQWNSAEAVCFSLLYPMNSLLSFFLSFFLFPLLSFFPPYCFTLPSPHRPSKKFLKPIRFHLRSMKVVVRSMGLRLMCISLMA